MIITPYHIEQYARLIQAIMETELDINIKIDNKQNQVMLYNNSRELSWKSIVFKVGAENKDFIENIITSLEKY